MLVITKRNDWKNGIVVRKFQTLLIDGRSDRLISAISNLSQVGIRQEPVEIANEVMWLPLSFWNSFLAQIHEI